MGLSSCRYEVVLLEKLSIIVQDSRPLCLSYKKIMSFLFTVMEKRESEKVCSTTTALWSLLKGGLGFAVPVFWSYESGFTESI